MPNALTEVKPEPHRGFLLKVLIFSPYPNTRLTSIISPKTQSR